MLHDNGATRDAGPCQIGTVRPPAVQSRPAQRFSGVQSATRSLRRPLAAAIVGVLSLITTIEPAFADELVVPIEIVPIANTPANELIYPSHWTLDTPQTRYPWIDETEWLVIAVVVGDDSGVVFQRGAERLELRLTDLTAASGLLVLPAGVHLRVENDTDEDLTLTLASQTDPAQVDEIEIDRGDNARVLSVRTEPGQYVLQVDTGDGWRREILLVEGLAGVAQPVSAGAGLLEARFDQVGFVSEATGPLRIAVSMRRGDDWVCPDGSEAEHNCGLELSIEVTDGIGRTQPLTLDVAQ